MKTNKHYRCPESDCNYAPLFEQDTGLSCSNGHTFAYAPGTEVPVFACEPENTSDYSYEDAARVHDNALRWVFETFSEDEYSLRKNLISRLRLSKGNTVLITGAGAGNDLPFLIECLNGAGAVYAQDISKHMLLAGFTRYSALSKNLGVDLYFSVSDATSLPFESNFFDAAYHFGGLNLFSDIQKGISEMNRVVKPGGRIVISDEGAAPWLKHTELGKMLINNNHLYDYEAPLHLIPQTAQDVTLSWELKHFFYVIDFTVSDTPLTINIDVPHIGKRGGSIRSRYYGTIEGINPSLKDRLYAEAEKQGVSRVEYLERLLSQI